MKLSFTRRTLLVAASALALTACEKPAQSFNAIDITGADYAKDFSLTDHNGQLRTLADFKGKAVVIFFGFTQCPDVCPTSMSELAQARQLLGADGDRLQGLFVSIDPERDTPEIMKQYIGSFDPTFLALYAKPDELPEVAKSFKVYYKKVTGSQPDTYTMDHSAGSYIYDPNGKVRLYSRYGGGAQALADDVKKLLDGA
ncbi:photosynthetic protein synthase I [Hydrogenophaga crassostreae]|uniref:Photosynthetic protein synthase I n=1 Tax=Hydrogenophaga crassostreae TaxID=1763535 RepID=A0A162T4E2_9BURK|nr:SCO family protein [Hydrogenophaga crassostreae]AOW15817.1 SCO family protein [Hydrogenophaga crassostreae]OAD43382.1 photosynthetic protein synthase I [Hydrogenophaga crassostreae]